MRSFDTVSYWENRYKKGGNSGAGSYGTVARLKRDFLTAFIQRHHIKTMVEYGCGDGHNLWLMTQENPDLNVTGVDISDTALDMCRKKMPQHTFIHKKECVLPSSPPDLVVSLEVIFHLIEDEVYEDYIEAITSLGATWLVVLSPDHNEPPQHHIRKRKYSDHPSLQDKYELVEEADVGSDACFSAWKIFRRTARSPSSIANAGQSR